MPTGLLRRFLPQQRERCLSSSLCVFIIWSCSFPHPLSQFYPSEKAENEEFKKLVANRKSSRYVASYRAAEEVGISGRALGKITSSFMVITSDDQKNNLGLSLKFEARSMKVVDFSRKDGRTWEYSQKAVVGLRTQQRALILALLLYATVEAMSHTSDIMLSPRLSLIIIVYCT